MPSIEQLLLVASVLLILSILASKTSGALGVPALLVFLLIGMLAGSDGPGGIYFDDARLAQSLGVVALATILFAGGLDTEWHSVRPVLGRALALATFGVLMTAALLGGFVSSVLGYALLDGLLLGAIVSSTDAAAVFAVLRSRNVSLKGPLKPLLELESGSNDPMAVFLTVAILESAREAEPGNVSAKDAAKALTARLESGGASLDDLQLAGQLNFAMRLSELPSSARQAVEEGSSALAQGNYSDAENAFKKADAAAPKTPVITIGKNLSRTRMLASLKTGLKGAGGGDENSAKALAKRKPATEDQGTAGTNVATQTPMPEPEQPSPNRQQALQLMAEARTLISEGKMLSARKKLADAEALQVTFKADEESPAQLQLQLAALARQRCEQYADRAFAVATNGAGD